MPSVAAIDDKMKKWSREWKKFPGFPEGAGPGIFNDLWDMVESYYEESSRPNLSVHANFERILGEMTALASWVTPG
jgi:hypothetical protein